jgi:hypothetical protein
MPKKTDDPMTECDNCSKRVRMSKLKDLWDIYHLSERIAPGGEIPAGECLDCGALAYLVKPKKKLKVLIEVLGGVAEVTKCPAGVEVTIKDHDNEQNGG